MVNCIGLSGQKSSGKDTVCDYLIPLLNDKFSKFERISFGENVKNILCMFSHIENGVKHRVSKEWIQENKNANDYIPGGWNMNVRSAMVNIGDRLREICPSVWIDTLDNDYRKRNKIITDVRYENELRYVKNNNGLIIRIIRPSYYKNEGNASEISLIKYDNELPENFEGEVFDSSVPYDFVIKNYSGRIELENKVVNSLFPFILNRIKNSI